MAPFAVSVVELPIQMLGHDADAVTVGAGFTVMVTCAVDEQPLVVPVTVYVVVAEGFTVTELPFSAPGFQTYDVAPEAFSVVGSPGQMVVLVAVAVTVGEGFTVTVTCAVEEHPEEVPVTVYVVVTAGVTLTDDPINAPGFQV